MKRNLIVLAAAAGLLTLTGCAGTDAQVDAKAAPGSPDIEEAVAIFEDLPLGDHALKPYNEDESIQLRQQYDLAGADVRDPKNADVLVEPAGTGCQAMLRDSYNLPMLHWSSLAAVSEDGKAAAQVFLAPSEDEAKAALNDVATMVKNCDGEATVTGPTGTVKVTTEDYNPAGNCPIGYHQVVTRDGVSQDLDVCYGVQRNALLVTTVADSNRPSAETVGDMTEFGAKFFERLAPFYTD